MARDGTRSDDDAETDAARRSGGAVSTEPLEADESPAAAQPPRFRLTQTVALVGLMGAGKSTIGRALAQSLGVSFRDADREIERAAAMSVPEIFERFGEPYFREGERRVIDRLLRDRPHVLATGGGAYMCASTRKAMKDRAFTIWLRADLETLAERCSRRGGRPLLAGEDMRATLSRLMEQRYPIYAEADFVVDSRDVPQDEVVKDALGILRREGALRQVEGWTQ
ncbi:MAG: shikimate kinase [Neomegalonema sp.]|nr:shikimate kinase [Neomegalonema sp.]